jgi:histidine ammonia-lyase
MHAHAATHKPHARLGDAWTLETLEAVARGQAIVELPLEARHKIDRSRKLVDDLAARGDAAPNVYGVNTGFGALAETRIAADQVRALQRNLVRSHACGVGPLLPREVVRAMMALRAQTIAMGFSGARSVIVDLLVEMLNRGVHPCVPAQGSVGASGDLAPLAHLALVLIGEGEAHLDRDGHAGHVVPGFEALRAAGLLPIELEAKEGLALINGTQLILAVGVLAVRHGERLCTTADLTGAMSLEALEGSSRPFDARVQRVRPHPGQEETARNLRALLSDSAIAESHKDCKKVQDPYSLRCMPQVHGATRDTLRWARQVLERELVAATDNPLVFADEDGHGEFISGGNFHGQPLAIALDAACIAIAELANCAERRIEQLVNPAMSSGLPPFLAPRSGLDSGFMIAQVTAAALVSENKVLCHPSSVDSIPSSAGKEDHVSMGTISARKCAQVASHVRTVLAIEAMVAAQGLDLRKPLESGVGVRAAHRALREAVPTLTEDRVLYPDIQRCERLIDESTLVRAAEAAVGPLT